MRYVRTALAVLVVVALLVPAGEVNASGACGFECNFEGFNFCIMVKNSRDKCWDIDGGCVSGPSPSCGESPVEPSAW